MRPTESSSAAVSSQCLGAITLIRLSRPDVRNAVDADTARALYAAFIAFEEDPHANALENSGGGDIATAHSPNLLNSRPGGMLGCQLYFN
jgi:enoyl-CoA hydratase/carnithine racemase